MFLSTINQSGLIASDREALQIPKAFKIRTRGLKLANEQGSDLERYYYELLNVELPRHVTEFDKAGKASFTDLLASGLQLQHLFLEAEFDCASLMSELYRKLGVTDDAVDTMAKLFRKIKTNGVI
jgi:hypothetical protein